MATSRVIERDTAAVRLRARRPRQIVGVVVLLLLLATTVLALAGARHTVLDRGAQTCGEARAAQPRSATNC